MCRKWMVQVVVEIEKVDKKAEGQGWGHEEILEWHAGVPSGEGFGMPMPGGMPLAHTNLGKEGAKPEWERL